MTIPKKVCHGFNDALLDISEPGKMKTRKPNSHWKTKTISFVSYLSFHNSGSSKELARAKTEECYFTVFTWRPNKEMVIMPNQECNEMKSTSPTSFLYLMITNSPKDTDTRANRCKIMWTTFCVSLFPGIVLYAMIAAVLIST